MSQFTHFCDIKLLAQKYGFVKILTNIMSVHQPNLFTIFMFSWILSVLWSWFWRQNDRKIILYDPPFNGSVHSARFHNSINKMSQNITAIWTVINKLLARREINKHVVSHCKCRSCSLPSQSRPNHSEHKSPPPQAPQNIYNNPPLLLQEKNK